MTDSRDSAKNGRERKRHMKGLIVNRKRDRDIVCIAREKKMTETGARNIKN